MHEAYLSLARSADLPSEPAQFSALASHVVRNVLVNHAVARAAEKRGYGEPALSLTQTAALDVSTAASDAETIDVQALQRLDALMFTLGIEQQKAGSLGCF